MPVHPALAYLRSPEKGKVVSAAEAVRLIRNGDTIATGGLVDRHYSGVSRYTTSGFLRMKLGESLERRGVAPHIFESAAEAQSDLQRLEKGA